MPMTVRKYNGFRIVAGTRSEYIPFVAVYTPNNTVAMNYSGDPYCTDVQEMIAVGKRKVDFLCDYQRLSPHQRALVARDSIREIMSSFNIPPEVAYGWKVVATMGVNYVHNKLFSEQWWGSTQIYESNPMSPLIKVRISGKPNASLVQDLIALGQRLQLNNQC